MRIPISCGCAYLCKMQLVRTVICKHWSRRARTLVLSKQDEAASFPFPFAAANMLLLSLLCKPCKSLSFQRDGNGILLENYFLVEILGSHFLSCSLLLSSASNMAEFFPAFLAGVMNFSCDTCFALCRRGV